MGSRNLITDWKRIGRSGPTVDGRTIPPEAIEQAAKNYDKSLFTALIWPEHFRYINLGRVEALRAESNNEGGRDLFAKLAPNEFYQSANSADQKLFTSMELVDNFRETGEYYLVGLGATDDPASAATSEIRFSVQPQNGQLIAAPVEAFNQSFPAQKPNKPSMIERLMPQLFKSEDDDMADKAALEKLQNEIKALSEQFAALKNHSESNEDGLAGKTGGADQDDRFAAQFKAIVDRLDAIEQKFSAGSGNTDKFAELEQKLTKLSSDLAAALAEAPGTPTPEHTGGESELSEYI